ncbi:hypothetical protein [Bradyrhizobium sp. 21]|uniref:hypothetical protein n=1 Tax=Bradyrhizobium sp. 21 TaxID=2782666 RepID=UPI001FF7E45F|nr:hypothetical protein [Bradyrhizobium sp. 21]MCK1386640.1 hypothetical protein [Bradyrhizobium sp. 21]
MAFYSQYIQCMCCPVGQQELRFAILAFDWALNVSSDAVGSNFFVLSGKHVRSAIAISRTATALEREVSASIFWILLFFFALGASFWSL